MIIRVNAVIPKTSEGSTVSAVINNNICKEREYVVSPSRDSVEVNAGRPKALKLCADAPLPKTKNIAVKKIIEAAFFILQAPQVPIHYFQLTR